MDLGLSGKVAIVTGGSRGLGKASALALAAEGAGGPASQFETTDVAAWKSALDLSLLSTIYLCRAVVPVMKRQGSGRIVAIDPKTLDRSDPDGTLG